MTEGKVSGMFERWNNAAFASVVGRVVMTNASQREVVSHRTERTREIGAYEAVFALMTEPNLDRGGNDGAAIGEFLARAVANARRQGIEVPVSGDQVHRTASVIPDEVDYKLPGNDD